jgi:hypothetical protein
MGKYLDIARKSLRHDHKYEINELNEKRVSEANHHFRYHTTLTDGRVLEHHFPSGVTLADARQAGAEFGEVVKVEPLPVMPLEPKLVSLDLALAAATAGLPITAEQFCFFLSQDDLADITAGLIPVETLRAYAELFSKRLAPAAADDDWVRCCDCANQVRGECLAAKQLGVPGRYHPPAPERPRRCEAWKARANQSASPTFNGTLGMPTPVERAQPGPPIARVRCADCAHFERVDRPHMGRCAKGHSRHWLWDTDRRRCNDFDEKVPVRKNHVFNERSDF